jgi:hypothetical protein
MFFQLRRRLNVYSLDELIIEPLTINILAPTELFSFDMIHVK